MYSIGEIAKLSGITAFTLRYYEKIGLLPKPRRQHGKEAGIRQYDDADLRFIQFIHGLKQTGMKLKDIARFTEDGCLLTAQDEADFDIDDTLHKRIEILDLHIDKLERQMEQLESVKRIALEKRAFYLSI
ncbi:MerR family transcriptional regulator [Paenibacillus sp.]|jgi:DNA-binding transcriptional MerR regulator|uniref:MerR family transcriptional regulator n=1 Tax=Paenibacillus sp. TaxID=58172 RepID=UPI002819CB10|nr:MerR family transcriptional regulator [Paenibacillus sp.]MDR0267725.1 MerR family transcriptional regulator [Paenibacillus sp.]